MSEEKKQEETKKPEDKKVDQPSAKKSNRPSDRKKNDRRPGGRRGGRGRSPKEQDEFDQVMIDLARVTRVMAGGKRMRFRACMVIGNRKGKLGWAVAKGADVSMAINKAVAKAKKNLITVKTVEGTIPHEIRVKFKAAKILMKPAKKGSGIKAGGAVRTVLELSGIENISAKILGSNNKINNVQATFEALNSLKYGAKQESEEKKEDKKPAKKEVKK